MALLFELMSLTVIKPLLLVIKLSCQIGARSICIIVVTWLDVLRFALRLHLIILWRLAIWAIGVLSLPVRAFTALYRERLLETQLYRLKNELENVLEDRKELEVKLDLEIKERKMMEMMIIELEDEHDEAILEIGTQEGVVRDLKDEVQRLKEEVQGKALSSYKSRPGDVFDGRDDHMTIDNLGNKSSSKLADCYNHKNIRQLSNDDLHKDKIPVILGELRDVAIFRSLFSSMLSLIVGLVVWESEDPCMPLVVALFTVVTMSLMSVIRLFMRIEHKHVSHVVALLSFNWFVLGTLAYPVLPGIARFLVPLTLSFVIGNVYMAWFVILAMGVSCFSFFFFLGHRFHFFRVLPLCLK